MLADMAMRGTMLVWMEADGRCTSLFLHLQWETGQHRYPLDAGQTLPSVMVPLPPRVYFNVSSPSLATSVLNMSILTTNSR